MKIIVENGETHITLAIKGTQLHAQNPTFSGALREMRALVEADAQEHTEACAHIDAMLRGEDAFNSDSNVDEPTVHEVVQEMITVGLRAINGRK